MTRIFNKASETSKRQLLRHERPQAEHLVWNWLRNRQVLGYKFRRQYSVGAFVLDFYCPALRLAIEIDGDSHRQAGAYEYDAERQVFIESFGIQFLRIDNDQVFNKPASVVEMITRTVKTIAAEHG